MCSYHIQAIFSVNMDKTISFTVTEKYDNALCKTFLKRACGVSARMITRLVRTELGITRNGEQIRTVDHVNTGDVINIKIPVDTNEIVPVKGELNIVFEDRYILIINKPINMPVHPTKNHQNDTLANIVRDYSLNRGESYTFRVINRIDRDTSGLVVIAKDKYTASKLKSLYKEYTAICEGIIECDGTINKPITLKKGSKMVREVNDMGARAVTHYFILKRNSKYTKILCKLDTGRTHQIRCHMKFLGYPLAGDDLYGGKRNDINRQALHCSRVSFIHPITGENIDINCPIPNDMKKLMDIDITHI